MIVITLMYMSIQTRWGRISLLCVVTPVTCSTAVYVRAQMLLAATTLSEKVGITPTRKINGSRGVEAARHVDASLRAGGTINMSSK